MGQAMSGMPWQLREGLKRRPKNAPPRPLVENLPAISVNDLPIPHYADPRRYVVDAGLRWGFIAGIRVSRDAVEFSLPPLHRGQLGPSQTFGLKHIKTGLGYGPRHAFICTDCGKPTIKVFCHHRRLSCARCHHATYASRALGSRTRPILQATRLASFLDGKNRLLRRTRERLQRKLGEKVLLAQSRMGTQARSLWD